MENKWLFISAKIKTNYLRVVNFLREKYLIVLAGLRSIWHKLELFWRNIPVYEADI